MVSSRSKLETLYKVDKDLSSCVKGVSAQALCINNGLLQALSYTWSHKCCTKLNLCTL